MADKQGELFPDEEPKKKPSTNPRAQSARRKRARKKGDEGQRREEAKRGGEQLTPEELWPNYPNMGKLKVPTIDPQDDWQTNPDFDREEGGWKPEDVASSFRNALTISNAIKKGKQALAIGGQISSIVTSGLLRNY